MHTKELIDAGLFGQGILIDTPEMLERYNAALEFLGLKKTALQSIRVDRTGWSPEVAVEQDSRYYLSHGEVNPLAIVLTPEQADAPIYFPFHSFDWRLMRHWYETNRVQIADITRETAICLDFEEGVDTCVTPEDLLFAHSVSVRAMTPDGLVENAKRQRALVKRFLKEDASHLDTKLIRQLLESREASGDLRKRSLAIGNTEYSDLVDFYARALGGVFVLRSLNKEPLLITRDAALANGKNILAADNEVFPLLMERGYLGNSTGWWKHRVDWLSIIAESFLIEELEKVEPECDFVGLPSFRRKSLINAYRTRLGLYLAFLRIIERIRNGTEESDLPAELAKFFAHPGKKMKGHSEEVVWQLLTYLGGGRLVPLFYRHQKTLFLERYAAAPTVWRTWALSKVREFYELSGSADVLG